MVKTNNFQGEAVGDKLNRGISFCIYADPGVGKTTMAATLPPGETFFINLEAGLGPLLGTNHQVFNIGSEDGLEKLENIYKYLATEKHPFKYVVVDNASEMEQWVIATLTRKRTKEFTDIKEYGDAAFKMKQYIRMFRDLVFKNICVVFTAWEFPLDIRNTEGRVITKTCPKLSKKLATEIVGLVDVCGHLRVSEKTGRRWLKVGPDEQYITKTQFQGLDVNTGELADFPTLLGKLYGWNYKKEEKE
jgi:phage nucleotide-binding protein